VSEATCAPWHGDPIVPSASNRSRLGAERSYRFSTVHRSRCGARPNP